MMKKILALIIAIVAFETNIYSEEIVSGYYVKNNNDTVYSKFLVYDLFELHNTINTIDSAGKKTSLKPSEIKAFSFNTQKKISTTTPYVKLNHSFDMQLLSVGYVYKSDKSSLDSEIHSSELTLDSVYNYESCAIDSTLRLFLSIKNGLGGKLHADHYYTKNGSFPFSNITIWFMVKEKKIVKYNNNDPKYWLLECISDYPVMKRMIQENEIKSFPFDFHFVIDDYNSWSKQSIENRLDTSMTVKGFLDANKYYKTTKYFAISCVTGSAFLLPGLVSAVIISHNPKEKNISIPRSLSNRENADYSKAFKHRAYEKRYRAAGYGAFTGGALSFGLLCCYLVGHILTTGSL